MLDTLCLVTELFIISFTANCATFLNVIFPENWNWKPETCYATE